MWSSIESLTKVKHLLELLVIGAGLITAFAAVGIWLVSNRLDRLKDTEDTAKRAKAVQTERALVDLQQKTRDRHLTPGLVEDLTVIARKHGPQGLLLVERSASSEEARKLADLINFALSLGGWKVQRERVSLISGNPTYGLYCVFGGLRQTPVANDLVSVFRQKGLRVETSEQPSRNELKEPIVLEVGLKP
jgi:hypothetical protein